MQLPPSVLMKTLASHVTRRCHQVKRVRAACDARIIEVQTSAVAELAAAGEMYW